MDELLRQITAVLRGTWQRRWLGLAAAWAVGAIGAVVLFKVPDKYEAAARVHLDTQSILRPLMSGLAVQPDPVQQVAMLGRTLISRPNIEKLVQTSGIEAGLPATMSRDSLVDSLIGSIRLTAVGRENLFLISYRDGEPGRAVRVVEGLISQFVEASQGDKRKDANAAQRFIEEQISTYEKKLEEAENRLKQFKLKNMGVMGSDGKDYFARMAEASREAERVRLELRAAIQSRDALKRELAGEEPILLMETPTVAGPIVIPEIDGRLEALRKQLDELLRKYTDNHPDVISTRQIVEQLDAQRKREVEARKRATPPTRVVGPVSGNPVIERLKVSLAEAEANIAALQARAIEYEAQYQQLRGQAQRLPQIEAELAQLNRDYEVQKKNYEALVSRRESAALSGEMGAAGGLTNFRVIDPPRVSPNPVSPNRRLLLPAVLLAALVAGVLVSFVFSQVAPTFHDARSLREIAQRPVLGTISLLPNDRLSRDRRRSHYAFFAALGGLVCVYGAVFFVLSVTSRVV
jgi:polysaccharide chain length determinant protein (PEP-CTERM system associated)